MLRFLARAAWCSLFGLTLLSHSARSWAADTTVRGVSTSLYAGGGKIEEPNNEGAPAEYDEHREGIGATGILKLEGGQEQGAYLLLAATFELESLRQTACGWACTFEQQAELGSFQTETHFAGRAGLGYAWRFVELRGGVLFTLPGADAALAESLVMPELLLRFGPQRIGWFELGLGAYDASTALRPGVFVGGAGGSLEDAVRVSGHFGLHLPNGLSSSSVVAFGFRGEVLVEHAFTPTVIGGAGIALTGNIVGEGTAKLSFLF